MIMISIFKMNYVNMREKKSQEIVDRFNRDIINSIDNPFSGNHMSRLSLSSCENVDSDFNLPIDLHNGEGKLLGVSVLQDENWFEKNSGSSSSISIDLNESSETIDVVEKIKQKNKEQ